MKEGPAQVILIIFEILNDIDPDIELLKIEDGIAYLKSHKKEYSEDTHIKIQERVDNKLSNISLYFT